MGRSRSTARACALLGFAVAVLGLAARQAAADAEGVKKYLEEARQHVEQEDWDDAKTSLELAAVELEDVPAGERDALTTELDAVRKAMTDGENVGKRQQLLNEFKNVLRSAKERVKSKGAFDEQKGEFDGLMKSDEAALLTDKERADFTKEMNTLAKLAAAAAASEMMEDAERQAKEVEEKAPGVMEALKADPDAIPAQRDAEELQRELSELKEMLDAMPEADAKAQALRARYNAVAGPLAAGMHAGQVDVVYRRLKEYWDQGADELKGWQEETESPTYEQYVAERFADGMGTLKSEKSDRLVRKANQWLDLDGNEQYQAVKDDPKIKALVDGIRADRDAALERMSAKVEKVVAGAEAAPKPTGEQTERLEDLARDTIGRLLDGTPQQKAFEERTRKVVDRAKGMAAADEEAAAKEQERLTQEAADKWPALVAGLKVADGESMNPAAVKPGELYAFKDRQNRAGAEYDYGQFDLIIPVNGVPVAAKYEPAVSEAIGEANSKFGFRTTGADDCIIEITGRAQVQQQEYSRASEQWYATFLHKDVPLGRVIALRRGPVAIAVAPGGGGAVIGGTGSAAVAGGGAAAAAGVTGGSTAGAWAWRILYLVAGLAAGTLVLVRARHPMLAGVAPAAQAQLQTALGANVGIVGVVFVLLGLWWLLSGLIYRDLLPAAALTMAGIVLALDLLKSKGVVKEPQAARLAPLAAPIGIACAALAVLHLLVGGWPLV